MSHELTRRRFLERAAALGFAPSVFLQDRKVEGRRAKLRLGFVGVGGRGGSNLGGLRNEQVAALCDVDEHTLAKAASRFRGAKTYVDWREMIAEHELDAVVVSTPDHSHAGPAAAALRKGLDVYCEKPLTHTVHESRVLRQLVKEHGAVTQMGTQIHALDNYRRVVELVQSGAIGPVHEVWVFVNKSWSNGRRPKDTPPVPNYLHFDLWLGPAPERPYHPCYLPAKWRRFWDFGGGTIADMACHYVDVAHWALDLDAPTKISAEGPPVDKEGTPDKLRVTWEHPAKGKRRSVVVHWWDGDQHPPALRSLGLENWRNGVLFLGKDGWLITGYTKHVLGPVEKFKGFEPPKPWIPKSIGHHKEWAHACKTRDKTTCNFAYSGALSETVLLGNVAYRLGREITWDAERGQVEGEARAAAEKLIHEHYRDGWAL